MMEKLVQPKLRFPEFDRDWELEKVGTLCDSIVPGRNKPTIFEGDIPWITTPDIDYTGRINRSKKGLNISKEEARKIGSKVVPINSVIISCVGELGLSAITKNEIVINQQLHAFIPKDRIEYRFLLYQLNVKRKYMDKVATKTAVPYMNKDNCNSIPIDFPSLLEQQKIADYLAMIDTKINLLEEKKEQLTLYKKAMMQKLFSQEFRFKDENGNDFPDWEEKRLGAISDINKGQQLNKENFIENGKFKVLNGGISYSGFTNSFNRNANIITISEGGNSCGYINYVTENFWLGGHCYALDNLKNNINDKFLFQNLKFNESKIMRLRVGSGLPNIQKGDLSKLSIIIPSLPEQQKIADFLSVIDESIENVTEQISQTQSFKKAMLQQMFV